MTVKGFSVSKKAVCIELVNSINPNDTFTGVYRFGKGEKLDIRELEEVYVEYVHGVYKPVKNNRFKDRVSVTILKIEKID